MTIQTMAAPQQESTFDRLMQGNTSPIPAGGGSFTVLQVDQGSVAVPSLSVITSGAYDRVGTDLLIQAPDGATYLVRDYFIQNPLPSLGTADGAAEISGTLVSRLAGPLAPAQVASTDVQLAQADSPIGTIHSTSGPVTIKHADGTVTQAVAGDPVFSGDEVISGSGAQIGIRFLDGSEFALGSDGRMVLDELIYDPSAGEGSSQISLLSGTFSFVSGQIAKMGPDQMTVQTPVATIGIRGTSGSISLGQGDGATDPALFKIVLIPDPSGTVGEIQVTSPSGQTFSLNQPMMALSFGISQVHLFTMSAADFESTFGFSINAMSQNNALLNNVRNIAPQDNQDIRFIPLNQDPQDSPDPNAPGNGDNERAADGSPLGEAESRADDIGADPGPGDGSTDGEGLSDGNGADPTGQSNGDTGDDGNPSAPPNGPSKTIIVTETQNGGGSSSSNPLQVPNGTNGGTGQTSNGGGTSGTLPIGNETDSSILPGATGGSGGGTPAPVVVSQTVTGSTPFDVSSSSSNYSITGDGSANTVITGSGNDTISAGSGNDTVTAGAGNDTVYGGDGDDTLIAGSGAGDDIYYGGDAASDSSLHDWLLYPSTSTGITVILQGAEGLGTAYGTATGSEIDTDRIYGIEHVQGGDGNDTITGNSANNSLLGGLGDDTLNGGAGSDALIGGDGSDRYVFSGSSIGFDTITDSNGSGDSIDVSGYATQPYWMELSSGALTVTFNAAGSTGFSVSDADSTGAIETFISSDGHGGTTTQSIIFSASDASAGNDLIIASDPGTSLWNAGDGNDTIFFNGTLSSLDADMGNGDDKIYIAPSGSTNTANLDGGSGIDTLYIQSDPNFSYSTIVNIEELVLGSSVSSLYTGWDLGNSLTSLKALGSATTWTLEGSGTLDLSDLSLTNASRLTFSISDAYGANDDTILGSQSGDTISHNGGNDVIDGQGGNDLLVIEQFNANETVTFNGGAGTDKVNLETFNDTLTITYGTYGGDYGFRVTSAFISGSELTATNTERVYGGQGNDIITGGDQDDFIDGYMGQDTLYGGAGSDTFAYTKFESVDNMGGPDTIGDWTSADVIGLANTYQGNALFDAWTIPSDNTTLRYAESNSVGISSSAIDVGFIGGGVYVYQNGSDVEVWYTQDGAAANTGNSYQIATLTGQDLNAIDQSNFINIPEG
jgi:Ca2+-binding RTX toxin-like protein